MACVEILWGRCVSLQKGLGELFFKTVLYQMIDFGYLLLG